MPRIETTLVQGYPGAGEIACVPPMAAIANAICNATVVGVTKLPVSPEIVLRALKEVADFLNLRYGSICRSVGKRVWIQEA